MIVFTGLPYEINLVYFPEFCVYTGILQFMQGHFEILSLKGSYTISESGGIKSGTGGLSISLGSADGRIIGGGVAGLLMAATPIQVITLISENILA